MAEPLIELRNIERIFTVGSQKVHGLRQVSLRIMPGEYVAIMGPSGSGKSTLLNIIGLLDRSDSGAYLLGDIDSNALNDEERALLRRNKIGFVFQFFHLVPRLDAFHNIELPLLLAGVPPRERRQQVERLLDLFDLTDRRDHRPDQLSGGQRQRVAIARAAVTNPTLLLADEPTGNLDRAAGAGVIEILEDLNKKGLTLVIVTHDPELGERAKRRIRMEDGAVRSDSG